MPADVDVRDAGPGFAPAMLAQLGKPYQSSKGRPGGGLGLFLVVNVARTVGGTVSARNGEGGAVVTIRLPLSAIVIEDEDDDERDADADSDDDNGSERADSDAATQGTHGRA